MSKTPEQMSEDRNSVKKSLALAEVFGIGPFKKRHRYAVPSEDIPEVTVDAPVSTAYKVVFTDGAVPAKNPEEIQEIVDKAEPLTDMFAGRVMISGPSGTGKSALSEQIRQMSTQGYAPASSPVNAPKP